MSAIIDCLFDFAHDTLGYQVEWIEKNRSFQEVINKTPHLLLCTFDQEDYLALIAEVFDLTAITDGEVRTKFLEQLLLKNLDASNVLHYGINQSSRVCIRSNLSVAVDLAQLLTDYVTIRSRMISHYESIITMLSNLGVKNHI